MAFFKQLLAGLIIQLAFWGLFLFLPAWRLDWPRAWVFLGVVAIASAVSFYWIFKDNEELLKERLKPVIQKDQPLADKIVSPILIFSFFLLTAAIPVDVFYLHLLPLASDTMSLFGLLLFIVGWWFVSLTLKTNTFAATVVKYQEDRGQHVINTGVYHIVRHPMYSGSCLLFIGAPLWLQSYTVALLTIIPILILTIRINIEERFLAQHLAGYPHYQSEVRYRLIPFIW